MSYTFTVSDPPFASLIVTKSLAGFGYATNFVFDGASTDALSLVTMASFIESRIIGFFLDQTITAVSYTHLTLPTKRIV